MSLPAQAECLVSASGKTGWCDNGSTGTTTAPKRATPKINAEQTTQIINAVGAIGELLDQQSEQNTEQQRQRDEALQEAYRRQAEDRVRLQQQEQQRQAALLNANQLISNASQDTQDWKSRAQTEDDTSTSSTSNCDCSKTVDICKASIQIVKKLKTGVDFKVSSSEASCSKVSYFIDNTPYFTVLSNSRSAIEHSASLKPISASSFTIERCDVCARSR
ncbi:hypothetical protein [Pseudomonas vanderleydeniana]|uniref:Uncharacterized protein n=1 Tax=Pseudomonas vanderleydeniana TaxID=2745495 RepID=A0A9E6PPE3_9PSED|nr:hypothetical protein [Pseudomonas vanderleydeniana]QXI30260.1 hypothetical protein HU752_010010 [Pseudomonas vanderleydeniana]